MNQFTGAVAKGLAAGAIVTTAAYMMSAKKHHRGKTMKRNATKAMRTVGNVMENIAYMMK